MIYGCGWDYDYAFCPCGYSREFTTSTYPDPDPLDLPPACRMVPRDDQG